MRKYFRDEPFLFKLCADRVIRLCVSEVEMMSIIEACHSSLVGGHHGGARTIEKILQCGYYWPTIYRDAHDLAQSCDQCQWLGNNL